MSKRFWYLYNDKGRRLIDVSKIFDICISVEGLHINGVFITTNKDDIERFLENYAGFHDVSLDLICKKLLDI